MKPITTVEFMKAADEKAQKTIGLEVLINRAGYKLANKAIEILKNPYGKKVVTIIGKGNNGRDGLKAASVLKKRGAYVNVINYTESLDIKNCDLVIDAIFGTGFRGLFKAPKIAQNTVILSCDIPSGLNGNTGKISGDAIKADYTLSFAAFKPGLLINDAVDFAGQVEVADIGLDVSGTKFFLIEKSDFTNGYLLRQKNSHKWSYAVGVIGGSPGMMGAAMLASMGAYCSGAGMVRLACYKVDSRDLPVSQAVASTFTSAQEIAEFVQKCKAVVIGPGLSRSKDAMDLVKELLMLLKDKPVVIDADALYAINDFSLIKSRIAPTVITPHEGEFKALFGALSDDRLSDVLKAAKQANCFCLLKGPTTIVGSPDQSARFINVGTQALATAGTGDVLSGVIAAFFAKGMVDLNGVSLAAFIHSFASTKVKADTLSSFDLPELISRSIQELLAGG
jgi:hydroxyethylthiazole kinase-like uncharacterized protein yjeF